MLDSLAHLSDCELVVRTKRYEEGYRRCPEGRDACAYADAATMVLGCEDWV